MNLLAGTKGANIDIKEADAIVHLKDDGVVVNEYVMDFPGEYESRGVFVEIRESAGALLCILTIDSKTIIYIPTGASAESLEVLRDVNNKDMVIFPATETLWKTVETWEASVVVPYGPKAGAFLTKLGQTVESVASVNIKVTDFESESTRFVTLG